MRWLCWFVPHKWVEAMDPELVICDRCDKLRKNPKKIPAGGLPCPYLDCKVGWTSQPPLQGRNSKGKISWIYEYYCKCSNCNRWLRFDRESSKAEWKPPVISSRHPEDIAGTGWWYGYSV